jgi:hypothetical protein
MQKKIITQKGYSKRFVLTTKIGEENRRAGEWRQFN